MYRLLWGGILPSGGYPVFSGVSCPSQVVFFPCGGVSCHPGGYPALLGGILSAYPAFLGGHPRLSGEYPAVQPGKGAYPALWGGILSSWGVSCLILPSGGYPVLLGWSSSLVGAGILPSWGGILSFWGRLLPLWGGILPSWGYPAFSGACPSQVIFFPWGEVSCHPGGYPALLGGILSFWGAYPAFLRGVSCPFGVVFFPCWGGILPSGGVSCLLGGILSFWGGLLPLWGWYPAFLGGYPVLFGPSSSLVGGHPASGGILPSRGYPVLPSGGYPVLLGGVSCLPGGVSCPFRVVFFPSRGASCLPGGILPSRGFSGGLGILGFLGNILLCNGSPGHGQPRNWCPGSSGKMLPGSPNPRPPSCTGRGCSSAPYRQTTVSV